MKKWDTIYLDWDGLLWDFKQAWCDWYGYDVPDTDKWEFFRELGLSPQEFQWQLEGLPREFWEDPKYIMPHAEKLVEWARERAENVFVLTVAPQYDCSCGKQMLANQLFGLGVFSVACAEHKVRDYAREGCLLIDDKPSTVVKFTQECEGAGGLIWPANYNKGLDESWYFDWQRGTPLVEKQEKQEKQEKPEIGNTERWNTLYPSESTHDIGAKVEKPKLDYEAMDEAKRRKMTPMYSGLLAYFPDALAQVAQNSMVGHYQHNDPNDPMYWDRAKSADDPDGMIRHLADHSKNPYDTDGRLHLGKVAWRALAMLQKFIEEESNE